ncbi:hypothetical protein [Rhodocaloribacter sp.]
MTTPAFTSSRTTESLHAMLAGIIDYAGLFPPARLPLDETIRNFARYRRAPEAWMLARFVVPTTRLADLAPYAPLFAEAPPFRFAVLGTGGPDAAAFLDALDADLDALAAFHARHERRAVADVMEVRLPAALLGSDARAVRAFLDAVAARAPHGPALFLEAPLGEARRTLPPLLDALAAHNDARPPATGAALKIRTGGLEPAAFPPPEALAFAVVACRDAGVRFKATAGLHHPVRQYRDEVGAKMHGFLNLFGAAVLAHAHVLDEAAVLAILRDEDPAHFRFTDEAFAWRDLSASPEAVRRARAALAVSFGSCSFDEPRDDLRALGLLPANNPPR